MEPEQGARPSSPAAANERVISGSFCLTPYQLPRDSPQCRPTRQIAPKRCQPSPSKPDQGLLDVFLESLEAAGSSVPNPDLRETLGWPEVQ